LTTSVEPGVGVAAGAVVTGVAWGVVALVAAGVAVAASVVGMAVGCPGGVVAVGVAPPAGSWLLEKVSGVAVNGGVSLLAQVAVSW
jgi:hypothetical protein